MIIPNQKAIQDFKQVQQLSQKEPVYITEQGEPTYVVMSYEDFQKLNPHVLSWEQLAMTEEELALTADFEIESSP